jgi:hypothetical protein
MYSVDVQRIRNEAHETSVANKIMDLLQKLEENSTEDSQRRWVWELIQNAKDVANISGQVDIKIDFCAEDKLLQFKHNGNLFSTKNLVYLIEQVSSKDREDKENKCKNKVIGKFGTGFLTTHLLSEIVNVSGILTDNDMEFKQFEIVLDRSGRTKSDITNAIQESYFQLDNSSVLPNDFQVDVSEFNTIFSYELDSLGVEVAEKGLVDLYIALPFVFAFVPEIRSVEVGNHNRLFERCDFIDEYSVGCSLTTIRDTDGINDELRYIATISVDEITLAFEVESLQTNKVAKYDMRLPKLFCGFPLVGTNNFPFPVVINSFGFNPTEPRDGIFLTDVEKPKTVENKRLMIEAIKAYRETIEQLAKKRWNNLYNLIKIPVISNESWYSKDWIRDNVVKQCKEIILETEIIDNIGNDRRALMDWAGNPEVYILGDKNAQIREKVWALSSLYQPEKLPKFVEIHQWYEALWNECQNYSLNNLVEWVESAGDLDSISEKLADATDPIIWLNGFYALLRENKHVFDEVVLSGKKVFLNQSGDFIRLSQLLSDSVIDEEYKDILLLLGTNCRDRLLNKAIIFEDSLNIEKYEDKHLFSEIENQINTGNNIDIAVYGRIIILQSILGESDEKQALIVEYYNAVASSPLRKYVYVFEVPEELYQKSKKEICKFTSKRISEYHTIKALSEYLNFDEDETKKWLVKYIDFLLSDGLESIIEWKNNPILPNQAGVFTPKEELFLDDGLMDEKLKDISSNTGYDIRKELLLIEVFLKLPDNRVLGIESVTPSIIKFIKTNQGEVKTQDSQVRKVLKDIYIWLVDNPQNAQKYFQEIWNNKHWLFNDQEIADNIKKAEKFDELMEQYNVSGTASLEIILKNHYNRLSHIEEVIEITDEVLIQSGIYTYEGLEKAISNNVFGENFLHESDSNKNKFDYVKSILERSKRRILAYLSQKKEYDVSNPIELDMTVYLIKKHEEELFLIIRPSDYKQVIIYYGTELDILDYEKDWELWVEDDYRDPEKITFGKILKLTGINKIPLRKVK